MNIGIVTTWFERGAAYVSRQFMNVLSETDNVYIYARGGEKYAVGDPIWDLPNVYWSKRNSTKMLVHGSLYIDKKELKNWISNNNIELIIFNEQQWMTPLAWCREWKIPTVAYIDYYKENTIPMFDAFDAVLCNTKRHAFAFRDHPQLIHLKWGTDISLYKPTHEKHEKLTFFNSAGMSPMRKGTDFVIQAFYSVPNRKKAKLIVHSQVPLSSALPHLKKMIEEMEEEGTLEVIEETVTAPGLYHLADVYVYPSRLDGIGLTLMEAASSGLACVTVDNPPMNEFIDNTFGVACSVDYQYCRRDGYYWPMCVSSLDSLTRIIGEMIIGEYDVEMMKINARKYAERELNFSENMKPLHAILNSVRFREDGKNEAIEMIQKEENNKTIKLKNFIYPFYRLGKLLRLC